MQRDSIVAGRCARSRWLTTQDAATQLALTTRGVRWLATRGELAYEMTRSGQFIFHHADVQRFLVQRADARNQPRAAQLQALRVVMLKADVEPRQLSLFAARRPRLRLVASSERALPDPEANRVNLRADSAGSHTGSSVNRKAGGGW